jgi:sugar phosphate isomerase/epimerase
VEQGAQVTRTGTTARAGTAEAEAEAPAPEQGTEQGTESEPETEAEPGAVRLGISLSDFVPERGHTDDVYRRVSYVEYGGHHPPAKDAGVRHLLDEGVVADLGRHLVSVELPDVLDIEDEARRIAENHAGTSPRYMVTDFGFWRLGGRDERNLWFRPASLTHEVAGRIARNVEGLSRELGAPVHAENPFSLTHAGELSPVGFMRELVARGATLCFDIGHFYAACVNAGRDVWRELEQVPFEAVRVAHIAGLSKVGYGGRPLVIDNHNVPPLKGCLEVLRIVKERSPGLGWVTYEAELASTEVQHRGLDAIERAMA